MLAASLVLAMVLDHFRVRLPGPAGHEDFDREEPLVFEEKNFTCARPPLRGEDAV